MSNPLVVIGGMKNAFNVSYLENNTTTFYVLFDYDLFLLLPSYSTFYMLSDRVMLSGSVYKEDPIPSSSPNKLCVTSRVCTFLLQ
jgi:hypothetical protein